MQYYEITLVSKLFCLTQNVGQGATNIQGRTLLKVRTTSPGQINVTKVGRGGLTVWKLMVGFQNVYFYKC